MSRLRVGVVLLVPDPVAHEIDGLRRALGDGSIGRVAPHVTLVPPLNLAETDLPAAVDRLRAAAGVSRPFRLRLGPVATFWPATPVLYLAVAGDDVGTLRERVFMAPLTRSLTYEFVPHVTVVEDLDPDHIPGALTCLRHYRAEVTITRVHLLRQGPDLTWSPLADVALGGDRVVGRGGLELGLDVTDHLDADAQALFDRAWASHDGLEARSFAVTARREGRPVGVALGTTDDQLVLDRLIVDAAARTEGVGAALLAEVIALGEARGCREALLVCQAAGPVQAWYQRRGWRTVTELPRWRHGVDFVRMRRELPLVER